MNEQPLYPLRFAPILKQLIWGGRRLGSVLGKPIGEGSQYAESWELADHRSDVSIVANGPLAGTSLRDLVRMRGEDVLGQNLNSRRQFPLLVKYIDANQDLSVQVHPDDEKGLRLANDNGKTETWVIVAAEPGSVIYAGLREGVTRNDFQRGIETGLVEPLLHRFPARPGDSILIPAGTMHAIGAGVLLAEVQQMSDATFRVFDWNRLGTDGKPRQLHLDQALESTNFNSGPVYPTQPSIEPIAGGLREKLTHSDYFSLERLRLTSTASIGTADRFTIVMNISGTSEIETAGGLMTLGFGETILLPASVGQCTIRPHGENTLLTCVVP